MRVNSDFFLVAFEYTVNTVIHMYITYNDKAKT